MLFDEVKGGCGNVGVGFVLLIDDLFVDEYVEFGIDVDVV